MPSMDGIDTLQAQVARTPPGHQVASEVRTPAGWHLRLHPGAAVQVAPSVWCYLLPLVLTPHIIKLNPYFARKSLIFCLFSFVDFSSLFMQASCSVHKVSIKQQVFNYRYQWMQCILLLILFEPVCLLRKNSCCLSVR